MSFLSSSNQTAVVKFYNNVMDDVLAGVREAFLDEGVDEQVLQELRHLWESKIAASKAIEPPEIVEPQPPPLQVSQPANDSKNVISQPKTSNGIQQTQTQIAKTKVTQVAASAASSPAVSSFNPINSAQSNTAKSFNSQPSSQPHFVATTAQDVNRMVPIQLTLPPAAGSQDTQPRIYNIQVPASVLAPGQLQRILTSQIISAAMALPVNVASTLLQQHITASIMQSQANNIQSTTANPGSSNVQMNGNHGILLGDNANNRQFQHVNQIPGNISQMDGAFISSDDEVVNTVTVRSQTTDELKKKKKKKKDLVLSIELVKKGLMQVDGIYDTDDDDDDDDDDIDDDDDDDDDENDKEEENEEAENGVEEDPLNSGDDVSEGDNTDLFETENVVVCQYDKINRSRNKWKFYLKDGIMNLAGRDYIFQKASGDAEW